MNTQNADAVSGGYACVAYAPVKGARSVSMRVCGYVIDGGIAWYCVDLDGEVVVGAGRVDPTRRAALYEFGKVLDRARSTQEADL